MGEQQDPDPWQAQREALGAFIRSQRKLANLSLRELADLARVSNPYLSQVERGLHAPSVRVLQSIARALDLSADMVMAQAGWFDDDSGGEAGSDDTGDGDSDVADVPPAAARAPSATAARAPSATESAIRTDPRLTDEQKQTLLAVYRSYVGPDRSP